MVLSTETFNQSVRTEYSEAVSARYTFQPLWVSGYTHSHTHSLQSKGDITSIPVEDSPQQVAVVLAEYRSMLCLQWTPSAEELGPGLDYVMEAEEEPGSISRRQCRVYR